MPPNETSTAFDTILALIRDQDCNLSQLAEKAGVKYMPLYNWVKGRSKSYNLLDGERVYYALTGEKFIKDNWEV